MDAEPISHTVTIPVPSHRYNPLKNSWTEIYTGINEHEKVEIRMNNDDLCVELQTRPDTPDGTRNLRRSVDFGEFRKAFIDGFNVYDANAMLRNDDLRVDSFEINGGEQTLTKEQVVEIEDATTTRIVIDGKGFKVLGGSENVGIARDSICRLVGV